MLIKQKNQPNNPSSRVNIIAASVMTAGLIFSAIPANAYIPRDNQISIRVNPVELETQAGVQRVYDYMAREATHACAARSGSSLTAKRIEAQCAADLLDDFVFDLNDKRLIDYHKTQISA
ncbi:MAG: UrcA family protein [Acidimicrobiales bacterium]|nr:UrcA family protein [Hyphomonadaceae bacterium]RZV43215.1 MAG: UrcA family protein [Acidimicrobiales bacterium]